MHVLRFTIVYFALVFGAGFVFGTVRVLLLVPRLGERLSELLEAPLMFVVIVSASRWIARRFPGSAPELLLVGIGAAALVLGADVMVGVAGRGMSPTEALFGRDPLSGAVYYLLVALFACLPWLLGRGSVPRSGAGRGAA